MYWVEMLDTGDAASMSPGTVNVLGGNVRHWGRCQYVTRYRQCWEDWGRCQWVQMLDTGDAASMSPGTVNVLGGNVRHWGCCQYVTRYRQCTGWKC